MGAPRSKLYEASLISWVCMVSRSRLWVTATAPLVSCSLARSDTCSGASEVVSPFCALRFSSP